jgi:hypothetical protein
MHTRQYDEYLEGNEDDDVVDVYQEEIKGHQSFTVFDRAGHTELVTCDIELRRRTRSFKEMPSEIAADY